MKCQATCRYGRQATCTQVKIVAAKQLYSVAIIDDGVPPRRTPIALLRLLLLRATCCTDLETSSAARVATTFPRHSCHSRNLRPVFRCSVSPRDIPGGTSIRSPPKGNLVCVHTKYLVQYIMTCDNGSKSFFFVFHRLLLLLLVGVQGYRPEADGPLLDIRGAQCHAARNRGEVQPRRRL